MATGWIRAYSEEKAAINTTNYYKRKQQQAEFRKKFKTEFKEEAKTSSTTIQEIGWGRTVDLPNGLSKTTWTRIKYNGKIGYLKSDHVVEIAYVDRKRSNAKYPFSTTFTTSRNRKKTLLWGDTVQIIAKNSTTYDIRARGHFGKIKKSDLTIDALLEFYFIDVAQGDGVLMITPDKKHMLIDGGLQRKSQQTGKNAADFVDWKFFSDYGDFKVRLDSMMASHSDTDHFGGLHDLVKESELADRELDSDSVDVKTLHHPGLSRWTKNANAPLPHRDGLGMVDENYFVQLLGNRDDAEAAVNWNSEEKLSGPWRSFIKDVLKNSKRTNFERVGVQLEDLKSGKNLPELWKSSKHDYSVKVLGPVTKIVNQKIGLKDIGDKGKNSNGHSICLRVDYKNARILLTGDLNKASMDWLMKSYGDRMGQWACDVAKACHHGSDDISYRFLEELKPAATIISSGDAEGHAHPKPEIVSASALTGFVSIDRNNDKLLTPLVYMTEIERSVSLGALNTIEIKKFPSNGDGSLANGSVLGRNLDEMSKELRDSIEDHVRDTEEKMASNDIRVDFHLSMPIVPFGTRTTDKRAWRSRIMEKNHYGLVNVRTDGETIMCATLNETEKKWIIHHFSARF
ncbi:hypothetical protein Q4Q39_08900 [Flavivirga amylovorans]|uniref:MBL fold metallo-hydrolase n=1 Tax=Flavivirga amylovorans TaxID=870486 RepID=A0ABT8X0N9_9FLAO|nr:hypothetical protein [Flavivirga amylovorans]MDO5987512.1 hypothetical protein [Flavivirga amylovorans]